ncbi:hypothetical protein EDD36DRAFT_462730 [Exophiala viscosa]|uniref:Apple domain-containing protein n=1 Tax=Exophiala viscosa TaxID=2486360 RepID=A0AAN6E197_9EURO|nr:hypothetical protein EDD36DRAFT_462730 [Exophiala viscosa]
MLYKQILASTLWALCLPSMSIAAPHNEGRSANVCEGTDFYGLFLPYLASYSVAISACYETYPVACTSTKIAKRGVAAATTKTTTTTASSINSAQMYTAWTIVLGRGASVVSTMCSCIETAKPCSATTPTKAKTTTTTTTTTTKAKTTATHPVTKSSATTKVSKTTTTTKPKTTTTTTKPKTTTTTTKPKTTTTTTTTTTKAKTTTTTTTTTTKAKTTTTKPKTTTTTTTTTNTKPKTTTTTTTTTKVKTTTIHTVTKSTTTAKPKTTTTPTTTASASTNSTTTSTSKTTTTTTHASTKSTSAFTGDAFYICTGADRPGGDLYSFSSYGEDDCLQTCDYEQATNGDCVGVVFEPSTNYCWLKNVLEAQSADTRYYNAARDAQVTSTNETCAYTGDVTLGENGCTYTVSCGQAISGGTYTEYSTGVSFVDCLEATNEGSYPAIAYDYSAGDCYRYSDMTGSSLYTDSDFASAEVNSCSDDEYSSGSYY